MSGFGTLNTRIMMRSRRLRVLTWPTIRGGIDYATTTQPLLHCGELATQTIYLLIAAAPDRSRATTAPTHRSPKCSPSVTYDTRHNSHLLDTADRAQLSPTGPLDLFQQRHTRAATIRSSTSEAAIPSWYAPRVRRPITFHQGQPRPHPSRSRGENAPER